MSREKVFLVTGGGQGIGRAIAELVHYLLSDDAGFVTGQNFVVDGGMTRKMIYA